MLIDSNTEKLLYRRQFILSECSIPNLQGWKAIKFGPYYVNVHPDLETVISKGINGEFLLLGFVLRHDRPDANNQELMDDLAATCNNLEMVFDYCSDLCGRYVIIFNIAEKMGLVNDLIGSRLVYYCYHMNRLYCASQPSTLARLLGIEEDRSIEVQEYISRDMFASGEGRWIGDGSQYAGVKHLLPNNYLDFKEKRALRYWPRRSVGSLDIEQASLTSAAILENTMLAATNRFKMSMAITAGWDSRIMLAATKKLSSKIYYYIQKFGEMTDKHPDIRIPRKLTEKIGIPFHIIECAGYHDEAFDAMLEKNVFMLHNSDKKILYKNFFDNFKGTVNASGNISDLCRSYYGIEPVNEYSALLELEHLSNSKYAAESLKDWYAEVKLCCNTYGYNLLDLFCWEQNLGNWGCMFASELDIAIDEFYPFGTRRLVETMLAVDGRLRSYRNSNVHRRIIEILWPELLSEPINPIRWSMRASRFIQNSRRRVLSRIGIRMKSNSSCL